MLIPGTLSYVDPVSGKEEIWLDNGVVGKEKNWIRCLVQGQVEQINDVNVVPVRVQKLVQQIQGKFAGMLAALLNKEKKLDEMYIPTKNGTLGNEAARLTESSNDDTHLVWSTNQIPTLPDFRLISSHGNVFLMKKMMAEKKEKTLKTIPEVPLAKIERKNNESAPLTSNQIEVTKKWLSSEFIPSLQAACVLRNLKYIVEKTPKFLLDKRFYDALEKIQSYQQFKTGDYSSKGSSTPIFKIINEDILSRLGYILEIDDKTVLPSIDTVHSIDTFSYDQSNIVVRYVSRLNKSEEPMRCFYSSSLKSVVINCNVIMDNLSEFQEYRRRNISCKYLPNIASENIFQNSKSSFEDADYLHSRILAEELRHAIDSMRTGESTMTNMRPLLKETSIINTVSTICDEETLQKVYSELSARLTAAAIDPIVFNEWQLDVSEYSTIPEYKYSGRIAIALVAKKLSILQDDISTELLNDSSKLSKIWYEIMLKELKTIRLALKAVYQDEFIYPIDEEPFFKIDTNGNILNRKVWPFPHKKEFKEKETTAENDQITDKLIQDILEGVLKKLPK